MPVLARSCLWLCLLAGVAAADPMPREAQNLTNSIRFHLKFSVVAEAPSDPKVMYLGTSNGRVHVTRDGGQSWEETTAITTRQKFVGAIRSARLTGDVGTDPIMPWGVTSYQNWALGFGDLDNDAGDDENRPNRDTRDLLNPSRRALGYMRELSVGGQPATMGGGAGSSARFGVGLRAGAPRLGAAVRRLRGWGVGINIKQTLALKGFGDTWINWIDVDPRDPDVVFAATGDGLRRSTDGGYSWPVVLSGATKPERDIVVVVRHPRHPDWLYVGTSLGLHVSKDGGQTFDKLINPLVVSSGIRWIEPHPTDDDTFLVAMSWGVVRTTDGGREFQLLHRSPWPALGYTRYAVYDPHDPKRIFLGTKDGMLLSTDDGERFDRVAGVQFVGQDIYALFAGPAKGQFLAMTPRDLWETTDGGDSWQIVYFGDVQWKNMYATYSRHRAGDILALNEGEVLRLAQPDGRAFPPSLRRAFRELSQREPTLQEAVRSALSRFGADISDQIRYRNRARWAALLPRIVAGYYDYNETRPASNLEFLIQGDRFDRFEVDRQFQMPGQWFAFGSWDLNRLMYTSSEVLFGRVAGIGRTLEWRLRSAVIALFQERRRLQVQQLMRDRVAPRVALMRRLRLEELTAHLNALCGPIFERFEAL